MCCLSMSKVLGLSFPIPLAVCFAPIILTCPFSRSMSETFIHVNSMGLVPKSFCIDSANAIRGDAFDMSMLTFSSVGIFMALSYLV